MAEWPRVWVSDCRWFAGACTPSQVGRSLYGRGLRNLRNRLARFAADAPHELWPRHSFTTTGFRAWSSDLDLTVWLMDSDRAHADFTGLLRELRGLSRIPLLEFNVFGESDASALISFVNGFELRRDPGLMRKVQRPFARSDLHAEAIAFALRTLESDSFALCTRPERRRLRWERLMEGLAREVFHGVLPEAKFRADAPDVLGEIARAISVAVLSESGTESQQSLQASLSEYARHRARSPELPYGRELATRDRRLIALFPHRFGYLAEQAEVSSELAEAVLVEQVAWEIVGLKGQSRLMLAAPGPSISPHLSNLQRLVKSTVPTTSLYRARADLVAQGLEEMLLGI